MSRIDRDLERLRRNIVVKDMLERWTPAEFRKCFEESRPFQFNPYNVNLILSLVLQRKATKRTKEIMKLLLREGANPLFKFAGYSTLAGEAFSQSDYGVALIFLNDLDDVNYHVDEFKNTALHLAAQKRNYAFFRTVLKRKPDLNSRNIHRQTALHRAVECAQLRNIRVLLDNGAPINAKDGYGQTVAHYAVAKEEKMLKSLILEVADIKVKDALGQTPLHMILRCPKKQRIERCRILLDRGADPNLPDRFGATPFHNLMTHRMHYERDQLHDLIDMFTENGALIDLVNPFYLHSALHICIGPFREHLFDQDLIARLIHSGGDANLLIGGQTSIIDLCGSNIDNALYIIKHLSIEVVRGNLELSQFLSCKIRAFPRYRIHFDSCLKELADLVADKFQSSKSFGLLDVLAEFRVRKLGRYCKNLEYRNKMVDFDSNNFPIYGDDLEMKFKEGLQILQTENRGYSFFSLASRGVLNIDCIEAIMRYIPPKELLKLRNI